MNTNAKHTTGPWQYSPGHDPHNQAQIYGENGKTLAVTYSDEGSANARMVAAAPDLLYALKEAKSMLETAKAYFPKSIKNRDRFSLLNVLANAVDPAIAKAEGGAQ